MPFGRTLKALFDKSNSAIPHKRSGSSLPLSVFWLLVDEIFTNIKKYIYFYEIGLLSIAQPN